jgi:RNA polymerase sigma-70 factor (ECF subfamily)
MAIPAPERGTGRRGPRWGSVSAGRKGSFDDDRLVADLYRQYRSPLMAFVLRLTAGDRQRAEDIVQETMLRAWRERGQLDQSASLMPWLATVARRIVIDEQRKRDVRPAETGADDLERASVTDLTDDVLRSVIVTDALRALSPSHREVLNATILSDRTVNEAAQVLGIPVGTVKSRVYYALRALKLVLAERGVSL